MNKEPPQLSEQFSNMNSTNRGPTDPLDEKVMALMNALYSAEMTLDECIQAVERLITEDKPLFERLVQFISDEIRYVSKYPSNETRLTAEIVGMMLKKGFFMRVGPRDVGGAAPAVAPFALIMRGMVEALRRPPTTKLFRFGVIIVEQVLGRIVRWPQLCSAILQISTFKSTYPLYHDYIESVVKLVPEDKRMLPLLDEPECARIFGKGNSVGKVPELYPAPIAEKDEREMHAAKIAAFKKGGVSGGVVGEVRAPPAVVPTAAEVSPPSSASPNVDQLLNDPSLLEGMAIPVDWFQDQTATLFNILCAANLEEKVRETRTVLEANKEWQSWFSYYLVKNRVSKETNQHPIYLQFIDGLKPCQLLELVTSSTFGCLRVLLGALNTLPLSAATHRSVLKNLGSWLGQITVARNKAIKTKDLDLKQLLLESFERGHLTTTLPLVCRVMTSVVESRVFKPPNPWTTAILSVLAELHDISNLRTNLVFEIEILFKKLEISLPDVKRSDLLVSRISYPADSQDFGPKPLAVAAPVPDAFASAPASQLSQLTAQLKQLQANWISGTASNAAAAAASAALNRPPPLAGVMRPPPPPPMGPPPPPPPPPPPTSGGVTFADTLTFPNLAQLVSIPPSVALFQIQPKLRPLVPLAVERAIREIINAVAERSVTISCLTGREIVLKDFASEPDEGVLRKSAQLMVGCLAGSLALVTCREPFRAALANHLKLMLMPGAAVDANEQALVDQVVQVITAENLDLGCVLVERAVYERATREICETVAMAVQARRLHREQQAILANSSGGHYTPTPFSDPVYDSLLSLPQPLKTQHLSVYREFRDLMLRMETTSGQPLPPALGVHPGIAPSVASPQNNFSAPPPGVRPPPPPPVGGGLPTHSQIQQLLESIRSQADAHEDSGEMKILLTRGLDDLVLKLSLNEGLATLPEIVETQPFQLDSYYGLISLGFNAEWIEFLRRAHALLARDPSLAIPTVWTLTKALTSRFESFAGLCIPLSLPPPVDRAQSVAQTVGCSVTEEHLFVELAFAVLALVPSVVPDMDSLVRALHTPMMAWIMELLFSKLNENSSDQVKSAMLTLVLGALRYNLVREVEMDRMLARLLTDHRTIGTTGFVVYLLQVFTCRMRMSPLQHWPITTEVIYKMLQRVTAAGPLIPPNEKGLAIQLDTFSKEMKAVANVSADRITAYRQLHCLSTRHPEPLPWDIVANQAIGLGKNPGVPGPAGNRLDSLVPVFTKLFVDLVKTSNPPSVWSDIPAGQIWGALKSAGCELDPPSTPIQAPLPDWVEPLFQTLFELSVEHVVDSGIALMMAVCSRSDVIGEPRPMDILRCKYVRKLWDVIARNLYSDKSLVVGQKVYVRILALSLQDAIGFRADSTPYTNAILAHFARTLYSVCPQNVPLFTFGWFDLAANRNFLPLVLGLKGQRGWLGFSRILQQGLSFVAAAVEQVDGRAIPEAVETLVGGVTKILTVLFADFPEFLCHFADELVHDAPGVHARNLLLAAAPRALQLPDPAALLPTTQPATLWVAPRVVAAQLALLESSGIRSLMPGQPGSTKLIYSKLSSAKFDSRLVQAFLHSAERLGVSFEVILELICLCSKSESASFVTGIVNSLRMPNSLTLFCCGLLQSLFANSPKPVKLEIAQVLLGRVRVPRPHPWGLLRALSLLARDSPDFARDHPEAAKLLKGSNVGPSALLKQAVEAQSKKM